MAGAIRRVAPSWHLKFRPFASYLRLRMPSPGVTTSYVGATMIRVAINGFGRIGRNVLRAISESGRTDIEVVGINDLGPVETNAHLLRFDTVHGRFPGEVIVKGDSISSNGKAPIKVTAIKDPAQLPWKDQAVDVAMECTGIFTAK